MTFKLYSISLCPNSGFPVQSEGIDQVLSTMGDWIRFSPWQWFLFSDRPKAFIAENIKAKIHFQDNVIVMTLHPELASGYSQQWIWNWLNDKMNKLVTQS